jgi:indolepyruvate ferredoxin oxidoreductase beta subunit
MSGVTNIVLAGVGGQGSVLAGQMIARTAVLEKRKVATSEVHGMAQRGGSVFSAVRFGEAVYSPVIPIGEADFLVGFEKLEALRYLPYLKPDGVAIVNDQRIMPTLEALKKAPYPRDVAAHLKKKCSRSFIIPGLDIANRLGNPRLANSALLGALSTFLPFEQTCWHAAIQELVPSGTTESNLAAFDAGLIAHDPS